MCDHETFHIKYGHIEGDIVLIHFFESKLKKQILVLELVVVYLHIVLLNVIDFKREVISYIMITILQ